MNKWIGISLGAVVGISHIGMIGMLSTRSSFPRLDLPVGEYTSYSVRAGKDGYAINYRANDPLIMGVRKNVDRPAGFLGLGRSKTNYEEQYTMDGARHISNPDGSPKISAARIKCIKAAGGGESTGKIVGGSVGATLGSSLSGVPFVGWVLTGAATMMGMDAGSEIGGSMAETYAGCIDEENS